VRTASWQVCFLGRIVFFVFVSKINFEFSSDENDSDFHSDAKSVSMTKTIARH